MKKSTFYFTSRNIKFLLSGAAFIALCSFSPDEKVTICHTPPGNPDNCHEITISMNALQAHLDHGDKLFCSDEEQYTNYLTLVNYDSHRIIKTY